MPVELYVHPNTSQPQPKVCGFENGPINAVFFGKITDIWIVAKNYPITPASRSSPE